MKKSLNHRLTENVKLLQKVALFYDGKVLLLKRSQTDQSRPGCWDLPGGNSEWPETNQTLTGLHIDDAIREVQEETSITLQISNFKLQNLSFLETHFDSEKQVYAVIFGWKLELDYLPSIVVSDEHTEYVWADVSQLDSYDFGTFGTNGHWIKDVIR